MDAAVHINDKNIPTVESILAKDGFDQDHLRQFREASDHIGRGLLSEDGRSPEWVEEKTFGYGNTGSLVVTSYNTPTVTLTSLWKDGIVDGVPWRPLLPRRKKR